MFKPTPSLNSRLEARLRGWRGPPTRILREERKRTDPLALHPAFGNVLLSEPQRGLPAEKAHKMMGLPMDDILNRRGQKQEVADADVVQIPQIPRYGELQMEELELGIARQKQKARPSHPFRARREPRTTADTHGLLPSIKIPRKPSIARYKPPSTSYWRHSIYTYNKHTQKDLPITTMNANILIRAYFNMTPSQRYSKFLTQSTGSEIDVEQASVEPQSSEGSGKDNTTGQDYEEAKAQMTEIAQLFKDMTPEQRTEYPVAQIKGPWRLTYKKQLADLYSTHDMSTEDGKKALAKLMRSHEKDIRRSIKIHKTSSDKIWVSDRGYTHKGLLRQDLLGKISQRMQPKSSFHYPFRDLIAAQPQITYKHYRDGVGISVHVHRPDGDLSSKRQDQRSKSRQRS